MFQPNPKIKLFIKLIQILTYSSYFWGAKHCWGKLYEYPDGVFHKNTCCPTNTGLSESMNNAFLFTSAYLENFSRYLYQRWGFPGDANGKEPTCQCRRFRRQGFNPCTRKIPWSRARQCTPVFLPGESHRQRSLTGYHQ